MPYCYPQDQIQKRPHSEEKEKSKKRPPPYSRRSCTNVASQPTNHLATSLSPRDSKGTAGASRDLIKPKAKGVKYTPSP